MNEPKESDSTKNSEDKSPVNYCGDADLQMPGVVFHSDKEVNGSVLTGLILEGISHIPDAYWFMNRILASDVIHNPNSVFIAGLRQRRIIPRLRGSTFEEALIRIRDDSIVGLLPDDTLDQLVPKLQDGFYAGKPWPKKSVGREFRTAVETTISKDEPPPGISRETWDATSDWRKECVIEAINRPIKTKDGWKKSESLRRGELLDVVGRRVGWTSEEKVPNAETLINSAEATSRDYLRKYLSWINQVYHDNQAFMFDLCKQTTVGIGEQHLEPESLLSSFDDAALDVLHVAVLFPKIDLLLQLDVQKTLELTMKTTGKDYFERLAIWGTNANKDTAQDVSEALQAYCDSICDTIPSRLRQNTELLDVYIPTQAQQTKKHLIATAWFLLKELPIVNKYQYLKWALTLLEGAFLIRSLRPADTQYLRRETIVLKARRSPFQRPLRVISNPAPTS